MSGRKIALLMFVVACLIVSFGPRASAQENFGTILGTVTDPSGAMVPGATVTVTNLGTGISKAFETGDTGNYVVSYLIPGSYAVTAERAGFKKVTKSGITLVVDQKATVDITLEVGALAEAVTVTAEAPQVETATSGVGQVVASRQIVSLPMQIRDFTQFTSLVPGVLSSASTTGGQFTNPDNQMGLSGQIANGQFADANNYQIDGVSDNDYTLGMIAVNPSVDAIGEFKVSTNTYSAEYGRAGGANISVSIKSGTNQFHGDLYEFVRNNKFDATPWNVNRVHGKNPPLRENQFGGTLGGPIKKNRTFFFGSFERFTERIAQTDQFLVPDALQRMGDFSEPGNTVVYNPYNTFTAPLIAGQTNCGPNGNQPCDGKVHPIAFGNGTVDATNVVPASMMSKAAQNIVKLLPSNCPNIPLPSSGLVNQQPNCFVTNSFSNDRYEYDGRVDHSFRTNDQFFARFSLLSTTEANPPFMGTVMGGDPWLNFNGKTKNENGVIDETHQFGPNTVNEIRFGASHISLGWFGFDANLKTSDQVGIPGINSFCGVCGGLSYISIPGYFGGGFNSIGHTPFTPTFRHEAVFQYVDDVTHISGKHTIKAGADIQRVQVNLYQNFFSLGAFAFSGTTTSDLNRGQTGDGMASFLLGLPGGGTNIGGSAARGFQLTFPSSRQTRFAFFGQDDYRITRKLTLNLGLRYEYYTPPTDAWNNLANFDPKTGDILLACKATSCAGGLKPDRKNFAPRIGFAYSPDNGKTAIRSAFGISYYAPGYEQDALMGNYPFQSLQIFQPANNLYFTPGDPTLDAGIPPSNNGLCCEVQRPGAPPGHLVPTAGGPGQTIGMTYVDTTNITPRLYQWTFDVQRSLTPNLLLDVAYVGTRGTHMLGSVGNANIPPLGKFTADAAAAKAAGSSLSLQQDTPLYGVDPQLSSLKEWINAGFTSYNALQAKLEKRFSHGLTFLGSYTWSKALQQGPAQSGNSTSQGLDPYNYMTVPGKFRTQFDAAHMLVASYNYQLPFGKNMAWGKSWNGPLNAVLGGWEFSGISSFRSGFPFTPSGTAGSTDNGTSNLPNRVCNGKISNPTINHWFDTSCFVNPAPGSRGRWPNNVYGNSDYNILRGPGFANWDLALKKNFPLWSESRYLQFRAEFYDAFNNVNFANPGGSINVTAADPTGQNSSGNKITSLYSQLGGISAREIQFALKLYF